MKEPDVPDILYRGFDALEHARAFVKEGVIRFGRLDGYCNLEDARRRDRDEGKAQLLTPVPNSQDVILEEVKARNRVYVLCCSAALLQTRRMWRPSSALTLSASIIPKHWSPTFGTTSYIIQ
jgi:hypothetical protein